MSRITELYQSKQTAAPGRVFFFLPVSVRGRRDRWTQCALHLGLRVLQAGERARPDGGRGERDWRAGREGEKTLLRRPKRRGLLQEPRVLYSNAGCTVHAYLSPYNYELDWNT